MFFADFNIARCGRRGPRGHRAHSLSMGLIGGQGRGYDFVSIGKSHLAGRDLADFAGQPVIDFVADDQEAEHRAFCLGPEINRLHKRLVKMVSAMPPVAGVLLTQRSPEILLRSLASEPPRLFVQSDNLATALD